MKGLAELTSAATALIRQLESQTDFCRPGPPLRLAPYDPANNIAMAPGGRRGGALGRGVLGLLFPCREPLVSAFEPEPARSGAALCSSQSVSSPFLRRQQGRRKCSTATVFPGDWGRGVLADRRWDRPAVPNRFAAAQAQQCRPHGKN